jgi:hypothetical protein
MTEDRAPDRALTIRGRVDIAKLKALRFTAAEACNISGISPVLLCDWHREGFLPEPRVVAGRGHRRKYRVSELARIMALRVLIDGGLQRREAAVLSGSVLAPKIESAFKAVFAQQEHPTVVLFYGDSSYKVLRCASDCEAWLYSKVLSHAVLVLPEILAIELWCEMEDILLKETSKDVSIEQVICRRFDDGKAK